jgi:hypothetical protein
VTPAYKVLSCRVQKFSSAFGAFDVFRFFHMDYVARQFINLAKHFRKDLRKALSDLNGALHKQTEAIRKSYQDGNDKQSPPPEVTVLNNLPSSIEIHQNERDTGDERNYKRFMFLVTTMTLGALVIYADLVYLQYREMVKGTVAAQTSIQITKDSLLYVQRAFISTPSFDANRLTAPGTSKMDGSMRFAFAWENGGTTPTKDMTMHISERWFPNPLPKDFDFADYPKGSVPLKMFVGPKASARSIPNFVSAHDIVAIHNHSGHLYFWGWARYKDVFPNTPEHVTRFCWELTDVNGELGSGPINLQTAQCSRGNCWDDECK